MNNSSVNFYSKLRDKKSINIVNELYKYINSTFNEKLEKINDISEVAIGLQDFISKLVMEFAKTWQIEFTNNKNIYSEICDGFENLIIKSLHSQILNFMGEDSRSERLYRKYTFLNLKNFGIEFIVDEFELATQIKYFSEITQYRSPKEKLNVIVNFINYICSKYKLTDKIIIIKFIAFCIIKSNISNLKNNLRLIAMFRHKTTISSEEDYFISVLFQAIEFIEKMNHTNLKIKKTELYDHCDEFEKKELLKMPKDGKKNENNLIHLINKDNSGEELELHKRKFSAPILENKNDGILSVNIESLNSEYCSNNFNEIPILKFENMYNDFKIILKLVESLKNEYKSVEIISNSSSKLEGSNNSRNLIDY